jgi:hypothetical protein
MDNIRKYFMFVIFTVLFFAAAGFSGEAIAGSISGQVVAATDGTSIVDTWVNACPYNGGNCVGAPTQADGTYLITGILAGDYRVAIFDPPAP